MKRYTPIIILLLFAMLAALAAVSLAYGQNLRENEHYKKAIELQKKAEDANARGDYDKAYEYSEEAKKQTQMAADLFAELVLKFRANSLLQQAGNRLNSLKTLGVNDDDQPALDQAADDYGVARSSFNDKEYEQSIEYSNRVLAALMDMEAKTYETAMEPETAAEPEPAVEPAGEKPLPKYYRVRLIPDRRDCFWRIAQYDFIYGDPFKWRLLYDANKGKLSNPGNPDLILPGQLFEIPEIEGETREGEWEPGM
jgi:nucleoid-associated protein YgaU